MRNPSTERSVEKAMETLVKMAMRQKPLGLGVSPVWFIDSFRTVWIAGPRRSGNTTAMVRVARRLFKKPLFMFPNEAMARLKKAAFNLGNDEVMTYGQPFNAAKLRGRSHDAIFIDCATHCMQRPVLARIQSESQGFLPDNHDFCIVLVG